MLLHQLIATAHLIVVVCDQAVLGQPKPHQPTYKRQLRPLGHDAKQFRHLRQILQNNYRYPTDRKQRFLQTESQTPFFRRPIILLNGRKDGGPYPGKTSPGGKTGRNIKNWPSKNEPHARQDNQNNHMHLPKYARKVKLAESSKNSLNHKKPVKKSSISKSKISNSNDTKPIREAIDRTFLYSALTKGKPSSVSPKFIIKQAGIQFSKDPLSFLQELCKQDLVLSVKLQLK